MEPQLTLEQRIRKAQADLVLIVPSKRKEHMLRMVMDEIVLVQDKIDMAREYSAIPIDMFKQSDTYKELKATESWLQDMRSKLT